MNCTNPLFLSKKKNWWRKNAWREMRKNDIIANFIKFHLHLLRNQNGDGGGGVF